MEVLLTVSVPVFGLIVCGYRASVVRLAVDLWRIQTGTAAGKRDNSDVSAPRRSKPLCAGTALSDLPRTDIGNDSFINRDSRSLALISDVGLS